MSVLVLGMHRSGTSALVQLLAALGLDPGADDELIGAHESNPTGHWEVQRLTDFNDSLLAHLGGRWSGPPALDHAGLVDLAAGDWGERARSLAAECLRGERWVWKDPRVCLLAPFWQAVLADVAVSVVVITRSPLEVAGSLETRNGIGVDYGLALWERYQRAALESAEGLPGYVLSYESLLADPRGAAAGLCAALPDLAGAVVDEAAVDAVVDPAHRHQVSDGAPLPAEVRAVLDATDALTGGHPAVPAAPLPPERPGLQIAFSEHHRLSRFEDELLRAQPMLEELLERRGEAQALRSALDRVESAGPVRAWRRLARRPRKVVPPVASRDQR